MNARKSTNKLIVTIIVFVLAVIFSFIGSKLGLFETESYLPIDDGAFSVHFIDVGQGDCTLIKTENGNMLIDAGENGYETTVLNYLEEHGVADLEYFVATHPHSDHIGGAAEVVSGLTVKNVIIPKLSATNTPSTKTYEKMLLAIRDSGARVISAKSGAKYSFGDVEFTVLSPFKQDENLNNMSVTLKLTYGSHSFMFTGDAEKEVEKQLLDSGYDLRADVYKLAHHGSITSNSVKFFDAVNPEIAVISYGVDNSYGHPHDEIIDMLEEKNVTYYTTAESGNVIIKAVGEKLLVEQNGG